MRVSAASFNSNKNTVSWIETISLGLSGYFR